MRAARTPYPLGRTWPLALLLGLLTSLWATEASAQEGQNQDRRPWGYSLVSGIGYGSYPGGESASQGAALYVSRPGMHWRFSFSHATIFGSEGYGFGIGHSHSIGRGFRLGVGVSSGLNRRGGIFPKYQVGASLNKVLLSNRSLVAGLSYSRRQDKRSVYFSDRIGTGLTWYAPGPWVFGGHSAFTLGRPGERVSLSGGLSAAYVRWKRRSVSVRVSYSDGSYMLWPSQHIVDFGVWSYSASFSHHLSPNLSVRIGAGHDTYYNGVSFNLGVSRSW